MGLLTISDLLYLNRNEQDESNQANSFPQPGVIAKNGRSHSGHHNSPKGQFFHFLFPPHRFQIFKLLVAKGPLELHFGDNLCCFQFFQLSLTLVEKPEKVAQLSVHHKATESVKHQATYNSNPEHNQKSMIKGKGLFLIH